jgi:hypothetical protein
MSPRPDVGTTLRARAVLRQKDARRARHSKALRPRLLIGANLPGLSTMSAASPTADATRGRKLYSLQNFIRARAQGRQGGGSHCPKRDLHHTQTLHLCCTQA